MERCEFKVDIDALRSMHRELNQTLERMENSVKRMYESMETLNTKWTGPSNQAFRESFAADYQKAQQECKRLEQLSSDIKTAIDTYSSCESEVGSVVRSLNW